MRAFADKLLEQVRRTRTPVIVGLDPRVNRMPTWVMDAPHAKTLDHARNAIVDFHRAILSCLGNMVSAVKLQIAFYEQYGVPGLEAFRETIHLAKAEGLLVIVDAKRNDIDSTALAYANAFLGQAVLPEGVCEVFDVDAITVSPFLGSDSLEPFVDVALEYGKGLFILVKTSNPGSVDVQDQQINGSEDSVSELLARMVNRLAERGRGSSGYSSIGAVVGATFPEQAHRMRALMPHSIFLVPGYGAQGASAEDSVAGFDRRGLGGVVNASRSLTYVSEDRELPRDEFLSRFQSRVRAMSAAVNAHLPEDWWD